MWKWFLMIRPIWYFYEEHPPGRVWGVIAMGSPFFWWTFPLFLAILGFIAIRKFDRNSIYVIISYLSLFLLWGISLKGWVKPETDSHFFINCWNYLKALVNIKQGFFYYMLPSVPWMCLLTASGLDKIRRMKRGVFFVSCYLLIVIVSFFLYYPIISDFPISKSLYQKLIWLKSWI